VQRCPDILSYLQGRVDQSTRRGQFVLTGSQQFHLLDTITQTLAGRVGTVELLPFSYQELQAAERAPATLAEALWFGGYPPLFDTPSAQPVRWLNAYLRTYVERDVRAVVNIRDLDAWRVTPTGEGVAPLTRVPRIPTKRRTSADYNPRQRQA
jgi:hypothetical protein